ncbi:glycosyltransferase family protein [Roseburia intestinalis]|uniref:glycosyltransferase family protein n=1 Tax=Roseburia intestinalis TaxID=166486 RepID=UPI0001CD783D|nr:glycosyltransferase family protein [Roseburia intestinalis]CBL07973.1 hypothetical protein ROI_07270 [Roseburia intestinalis M50/1]
MIKKICFIMCVNDELYEEECIRYIKRLHVPEEYEVQQLSVLGAKSMADGYNEAMQQTDAKYKVFLHQDVFIVYKNFIRDLLWIFDQDKEIGMIGMVGSPVMPAEGVMWADDRIGSLFTSNIKQAGPALIGQVKMPYEQVEAIDGLLMATQADLPWREDIFDGWDFYDVSQSMEFRKKGYKVVVPHMEIPWCLHDDGYVNLERYFKWRDVFLKEYGDMLHD